MRWLILTWLLLVSWIAVAAPYEEYSPAMVSMEPRVIGQITIPAGGVCLLQSGPPVDGSTDCTVPGQCRIDTVTDIAYYCENKVTKDWTAFSGAGGGATISATGTQLLYRAGASDAGGISGSSFSGGVVDFGTHGVSADRFRVEGTGCIEKVPSHTAFFINQTCNDGAVDPELGDYYLDPMEIDAVVDVTGMDTVTAMRELNGSIWPYTKTTPTDSFRTVVWTGQATLDVQQLKTYGTSGNTRKGVVIAPTTNTLDGNSLPEIDCDRLALNAGRLHIIMVNLSLNVTETGQTKLSQIFTIGAEDVCGFTTSTASDPSAYGRVTSTVFISGQYRSFGGDVSSGSWQAGRPPYAGARTGHSTTTTVFWGMYGATGIMMNDLTLELNCGGIVSDHDDIGFFHQWAFSNGNPLIRATSCGTGVMALPNGGVQFENYIYTGTNDIGFTDMVEFGGGQFVASDCVKGFCSGDRPGGAWATNVEQSSHISRLISESNIYSNFVTWAGGWKVSSGYVHSQGQASHDGMIIGGGTRSDNRQVCCEDPDGAGPVTCDSPSVVSSDWADEEVNGFSYHGLLTYGSDLCMGPGVHTKQEGAEPQIVITGTIGTSTTNVRGVWGNSNCTANGVPWPCCSGVGAGSCSQPNVDASQFTAVSGASAEKPLGYTGYWKRPGHDRFLRDSNPFEPGPINGLSFNGGAGIDITPIAADPYQLVFTPDFSELTTITLGDSVGENPFTAIRFDTGSIDVRFNFPSDGVWELTHGEGLRLLAQRYVRFYDSDSTNYTGLKGYSNYTANADLLWRSQGCSTGTVDSLRTPLTINGSSEVYCSSSNETIASRVARGIDNNTSVTGIEYDFTVSEGSTARMPGGVTLCPTGEGTCACNDLDSDGIYNSCEGGATGKRYRTSGWLTNTDRGLWFRQNTSSMDGGSLQTDECLVGAVDDASDCISSGVPRACCTGAGTGTKCAVPRIFCEGDQETSLRNEGELLEIAHLTIANPSTSGDEMNAEGVVRLPRFGGKLLQFHCEVYGFAGCTSATVKICFGEDIDDDSCSTQLASIVCDVDGESGTSTQTFFAGDKLSYLITAVSESVAGDCNELEVQAHGTRN